MNHVRLAAVRILLDCFLVESFFLSEIAIGLLDTTNIFSGVGFLALKKYTAGGVCTSKKRMSGKTVIITGANCGIGKETAKDLVKRGEVQDFKFYIVQKVCKRLYQTDSASKLALCHWQVCNHATLTN